MSLELWEEETFVDPVRRERRYSVPALFSIFFFSSHTGIYCMKKGIFL